MALKDIGYVNSLDRKLQFTSNSRTRISVEGSMIFSDLNLSPPSLSKTGVSKKTIRYHNPFAKEQGVAKKNSQSYRLNTPIVWAHTVRATSAFSMRTLRVVFNVVLF